MKGEGLHIIEMEEDKQSGVVDRKRQTRQKNGGSTKQTINKTSPEYIRTRSCGSRLRGNSANDTDRPEQLLKTKCRRMRRKIARELFPSNNHSNEQCNRHSRTGMGCKTQMPTWRCSDDDDESQEENNDKEDQIEGYSSENDKGCMYRLTDEETPCHVGEWFKFEDPPRHKMILYHGQRFRDVSHFRKAIEVFAICDGFKLCVMENRAHVVSYECFDLRCDWKIKAERVVNGRTFIVTEFVAQHKCTRRHQQFQHRSKWISAIYLHRWKLQPNLRTVDIRDEIKATYGFKDEMERINSRNIVLLETKRHEYGEVERFKRMFVCWERTSYAFKNQCRRLLAVDGWKINNPYNSVMLVAAALDGNNGLCIMGDGDNGIDYAVEEFLPKTVYRQCCLKIFTEMVKRFPTTPVEHFFWSACRSTSATSFNKYMDLIHNESEECHDWLLQTDWSSWALFTIPKWVKCTCVTLSITDKLRNYLHQYLEMSIASRFVAIARLTAKLFERRRIEVWNWYREKVTPTVREVIKDRTIDGQRFVLVEENGTRLKLTDTTSIIFDLNMEAQSCNCGLWQISGIPCAHACKGIQLIMGNVEEYVDNMMSIQNFCSMYTPGMMPFPKKHAWKWGACNKLLPPMIESVNTLSMKGSNESASSRARQCIENNSDAAINNPQVHMWTHPNTLTHSAEEKDSLRIKSTSSDGSLSM
ncbi:hypothetical protein KPL71_001683 [Citrus sinensis]|uniref:Uncharacterized protein n=2 Tax=Citrus sinensis TaxID=2711 RepID=A0ACB8P0E3_CITSI|nr:hypothetical protein KPL71_001683 [Citrus sinensis]